MKFKDAKPWQKDPESLTTKRVQVWSVGGIMIGTYPLTAAKEAVANGHQFVISDQAIGDYEDRYATYNE